MGVGRFLNTLFRSVNAEPDVVAAPNVEGRNTDVIPTLNRRDTDLLETRTALVLGR